MMPCAQRRSAMYRKKTKMGTIRRMPRVTVWLGLSLLLGSALVLGRPHALSRDAPHQQSRFLQVAQGRYLHDVTSRNLRQHRVTPERIPIYTHVPRRPRAAAACCDTTVDVLTQHNDNGRTGANLHETTLNTKNVNVNTFGKLFMRPVNGQIYVQPLYVSSLHIPHQGIHNVVVVATTHNSVYAFDADDPTASTPLWKVSLGASIPVTHADFGGRYGPYHDITVEVGIVSTPVIDRVTDTIYVLTANRAGSGHYLHRLHALDLLTGAEKFGGPVPIQGAVPGHGAGSVNGVVNFDNKQQLQRAALLLANGRIYVAFGGYADTDPFHGWIFAYNAYTLRCVATFNVTPTGGEGGIWQSGWGPAAVASGHVYVATGNGDWDAGGGGSNYGESYVKFQPNLTVDDWFTPWNQSALQDDQDLGSTGLMLIPGTRLLVSGDKQGTLYLLKQDNMGHYNARGDTQIVQSFQAAQGQIMGGMTYWNGPAGTLVYLESDDDRLKAFKLSGGHFATAPASQSTMPRPLTVTPSTMLSLSAAGSTAGTGIVWALYPNGDDTNQGMAPGILRAFDASDVSRELWDSQQDATRDDVGTYAKFSPPTIANGKVYVPTFSGYLAVYGLLPRKMGD